MKKQSETCTGCNKMCQLGATQYKPFYTPSFYRPTIANTTITKYSDEQGTHYISTTAIDSYKSAVELARKIAKNCPHNKNR